MDVKQQVEEFFSQYEERFNKALKGAEPDIEGTVNSFAEYFVESSPTGIICGKNDETFKKKIPEGHAFYKKIGITAMNILSKEVTILDNIHAMSKIKIFSYITGDEQKALKENGLV